MPRGLVWGSGAKVAAAKSLKNHWLSYLVEFLDVILTEIGEVTDLNVDTADSIKIRVMETIAIAGDETR